MLRLNHDLRREIVRAGLRFPNSQPGQCDNRRDIGSGRAGGIYRNSVPLARSTLTGLPKKQQAWLYVMKAAGPYCVVISARLMQMGGPEAQLSIDLQAETRDWA